MYHLSSGYTWGVKGLLARLAEKSQNGIGENIVN
jgi:hypothetical protein